MIEDENKNGPHQKDQPYVLRVEKVPVLVGKDMPISSIESSLEEDQGTQLLDPQSTLMTHPGFPQESKAPLLGQLQTYGKSARGAEAFLAGAASPLMKRPEKLKISASDKETITITNKMQSTKLIGSKKPVGAFHGNQSNASDTQVNITASGETSQFSPLKLENSGDRFIGALSRDKDGTALPHTINKHAHLLQKTNQDFAVQIQRKFDDPKRTDQSFIPQPSRNDPALAAHLDQAINVKGSAALTLNTQGTSKMFGNSSSVVDYALLNQQSFYHAAATKYNTNTLASSMQFDKIRYQNLSKLTAAQRSEQDSQLFAAQGAGLRNVVTLPRKTEQGLDSKDKRLAQTRFMQSSLNSEQKHILLSVSHGVKNHGAPAFRGSQSPSERDQMAQTMYIQHDRQANNTQLRGIPQSMSPSAHQTQTDFKCRYQELTWKQCPPGAVPTPLTVGIKPNQKYRSKVSKRSSVQSQMHQAKLEGQAKRDAIIAQMTTANKKMSKSLNRQMAPPDPYGKRVQRSPGMDFKFPSIRQQRSTQGSLKPVEITQNELTNQKTIEGRQTKNEPLVGNSTLAPFKRPKDSVMSHVMLKRRFTRDGVVSQDTQAMAVDSRHKTAGVDHLRHQQMRSYLQATEASTANGDSKALLERASQNRQPVRAGRGENSSRQTQGPQGQQLSDETARKLQEIAIRDRDEKLDMMNRTFEIKINDQLSASVYFNESHAQKEDQKEFDKIYGAQKGRLYRAGTQIGVDNVRTMEDQRHFLHPVLKQIIKTQYDSQVKEASKPVKPIKHQSSAWKASRHHSQYASEDSDNASQADSKSTPRPKDRMAATMREIMPPSRHETGKSGPILIEQSDVDRINYQISNTIDEASLCSGGSALSSVKLDSQNVPNASQKSKHLTPFQDEPKLLRTGSVDVPVDARDSMCTEKGIFWDDEEAFETFKALGSFLKQTDRQIITMDNNGGLHYEQKNDLNNTFAANQLETSKQSKLASYKKTFAEDQEQRNEKWDKYKDDVLRVVKKGILSNKPKPRKVIPPPIPEPEINRLLHMEVRTIKQLLSHFTEAERHAFNEELIYFSLQENPTRYLIERMDELWQNQKDVFAVRLCQVYKFLFKKRIELAHNKRRMAKFNPSEMEPHFERYMRKVYNEIVSTMRAQITKSMIEAEVKVHGEAHRTQATFEAAKDMSLTRMKEKKVSVAEKTAQVKDKRIVDYIKYLIGQTANNEFQLRKEEFSQTHELHTKSLVLPFDHYAAKEDDAMKKVANDILERVEMNVVIQESHLPIAVLKYADDPKFAYFLKLQEEMAQALPLLAKVVNKQLSLHNYTLGLSHATAFAETCKFNPSFMSKLVLNNNGLSDKSLATLLGGLQHMDTISVIDLRKNQVGENTVQALSSFFLRSFPSHLQVLRLVDCQMSQQATFMLLRLLGSKSCLRALSIVGAQFDEKTEKELVKYLQYNISLKELDLSWNQMTQAAYIQILKSLVDNNNLLTLNFSHNKLIVDPKGFANQKTAEAIAIKQDKMAVFAKRAQDDAQEHMRVNLENQPVSNMSGRGSSASSRRGHNVRHSHDDKIIIGSQAQLPIDVEVSRADSVAAGASATNLVNVSQDTNLLNLNKLQRQDSAKSYRSQSRTSCRVEVDEIKAKRVLNAQKHVFDSSEGNQLITHLLTKVMKENRQLQHLDLSSTNMPSQVIIHLCERLRKSRSILSCHFTDNPGLQEPALEDTVHELLKCKPRAAPPVKINVNNQIDFALDSNMLERLKAQLRSEKVNQGSNDETIARDTIRFRQVMQQKRIEQKAIEFPRDPEHKNFVLSRVIGFKEQIPGSGQWQLLSQNHEKCWHCDQWLYSLIFWDADTIGKRAKAKTHPTVINQMVKKVRQLNPDLNANDSVLSLSIYNEEESELGKSSVGVTTGSPPRYVKKQASLGESTEYNLLSSMQKSDSRPVNYMEDQDEDTTKNPIIFGSFNNWKGQKMMKLEDFVMLLVQKYGRQNQEMHEDFNVIVNIMREELGAHKPKSKPSYGKASTKSLNNYGVDPPGESVRSFNDLTEKQQDFYKRVVKHRQKRILHDWKGIIEQYLEYRKPFLVDAYQLNKPAYQGRCPNLYVLPAFLPAGKHTYLVRNMETLDHTMHTTLCDFRTEDVPVIIKELKFRTVERVFRKENSVFDPWQEDTDIQLQHACENDIGASRISKVVKDPHDLTRIYDFLSERFAKLKLLFLKEACGSNYPHISFLSLEEFCQDLNLFDSKFKMSACDICFTAANSKPIKGQLKTGLNRSDFLEVLVRIALQKYLDGGFVKTALEAVQYFVDDVILQDFVVQPPWHEFRKRYLWTLDVNDVLAANQFGLHKLYNRQQTIHKSWLEFSEACYIFTTEAPLVTDFAFKFCYGYCKMTIENEQQNAAQHQRLQYVEFLELIGRVAAAYWEANKEHLQEVPLAQKIEFILDQILPLVGQRRNEVNVHIESESCTDEDY